MSNIILKAQWKNWYKNCLTSLSSITHKSFASRKSNNKKSRQLKQDQRTMLKQTAITSGHKKTEF